MTSMEKESGAAWSVEEVAARAGELFASRVHQLCAEQTAPV
jgi:hypothetical protein